LSKILCVEAVQLVGPLDYLALKEPAVSERSMPCGSFSIGIHGMQLYFFESLFAVLDDGCEFGKRHQLVWLYEVFFFFGSRCARIVSSAGVRFFPVYSPSNKVGRCFSAGFVSRFEDDSVSKIENCYFGFLSGSQSRKKRGFRLSGHDSRRIRLPYNVDITI
jgi:hypothetical protein